MKKVICFFLIITVTFLGLIVIQYYNSEYYRFHTQFQLGWDALTDEKGDEALKYWLPIAKEGNEAAQLWVYQTYADGYGGVKRESDLALYWCNKYKCNKLGSSCEANNKIKNNQDCAFNIAFAFANDGPGEPRFDFNESIKWLKISSSLGNESATKIIVNCVNKKFLNESAAPACLKNQFKKRI